MGKICKTFALFLTGIIAMSCLTLLMVKPSNAQVPTPPDVPTLGPIIICDQGNYVNIAPPETQNYPNNPIQLTFTITVSTMLGQFGNVGYSIDGGVVTSIRNTHNRNPSRPLRHEWYYYTETASASLDLPQLTDGAHNVTVYYGWQYLGVPQNPSLQRFEVYAYQSVNFTIGTPQPTPSPSPPEFTAKFVASSIEVTIKNQPITAYVTQMVATQISTMASDSKTMRIFKTGIMLQYTMSVFHLMELTIKHLPQTTL